MNLERIIRPFQTGDVLATKRIVKSTAVATGETAFLSWGAAGAVPKGIMQNDGKPHPAEGGGGFKVVKAQQTWTQTGEPVTEDVVVDGVKIKRVREITFKTVNDESSAPQISSAAQLVSDIVEGLRMSIEGSRVSSATYKTKWG